MRFDCLVQAFKCSDALRSASLDLVDLKEKFLDHDVVLSPPGHFERLLAQGVGTELDREHAITLRSPRSDMPADDNQFVIADQLQARAVSTP